MLVKLVSREVFGMDRKSMVYSHHHFIFPLTSGSKEAVYALHKSDHVISYNDIRMQNARGQGWLPQTSFISLTFVREALPTAH